MNDVYPLSWVTAKLVTVFKQGCRSEVSNYRGISIINIIAKLYMVLSDRLHTVNRQAARREEVALNTLELCVCHVMRREEK